MSVYCQNYPILAVKKNDRTKQKQTTKICVLPENSSRTFVVAGKVILSGPNWPGCGFTGCVSFDFSSNILKIIVIN